MREQPVLRIAFKGVPAHVRRLPIRGTRYDRPQQALHVPARAHKFNRQPVEQLRMARRLALRPKSSSVLTSPVPKNICQSRLTATRAERGLLVETSHRASARRFETEASVPAERHRGTPGETLAPGRSYWPRTKHMRRRAEPASLASPSSWGSAPRTPPARRPAARRFASSARIESGAPSREKASVDLPPPRRAFWPAPADGQDLGDRFLGGENRDVFPRHCGRVDRKLAEVRPRRRLAGPPPQPSRSGAFVKNV